jgi:N-carbamoylputrescine amidase
VSRLVRIAVEQLAWQEPGPGARDRVAARAAARFRDNAEVVVLPELAVPGYTTDRDVLNRLAEPIDGPTVRTWQSVARAGGGYVVGGFCERSGDSLFNTAVVVGGSGLVLHYRKTHLFADEKAALSPGDLGFPIVETDIGTIGVCVCYDLRFVEVIRLLAIQGADLICVPTAWVTGYDTRPAGEVPQQVTGLLAQANLSQVFIAAASFAGGHGAAKFLGNSVIADPFGEALVGPLPGDRDDSGMAIVDLDRAEAARHRSEVIHPREERRRDVYGIAYRGHEY